MRAKRNDKHYQTNLDIIINLIPRKAFNLTGTASQEMHLNSTSLLATLVEITKFHELLNATAIKTNYLFSYQVRC